MITMEMYCIYKMIWETCGEDKETLEECHIIEIDRNTYHITYNEDDPFYGVDFKVKINILSREVNSYQHKVVCQYSVYDSVYGDDGDFEIEL